MFPLSHLPKKPQDTLVVVGMSGGVDSSVSALLLKEQGFQVVGLFMKNWEDDELCPAAQDFADVQQVASRIGIPCYPVNFSKQYWDLVFSDFLREYAAGHTPNPDILCNREIKFNLFLKKALEMGADFLATGHYAQNHFNGEHHLMKGADPEKDPTYFLYTLNRDILSKVLFPIGHLPKAQVRQIARDASLITADKKDSVGICFIGKRNFKEFLSQYIPARPGAIENLKGEVIGSHQGICYYTIGQRKGLGIGGQGEAWFVIGKDVQRNVLIAEQGEDHPSLYSRGLIANSITFVSKEVPSLPYRCQAKVRYRQVESPCLLEKIEGDRLFVTFDRPQKAVTPRQSIVFYDGERCLGGAIIEEAIV
ncbi:MAG: mnmA [Chlamydiales bacterium]|jgi:tRNA-specific 2-thiouridylase|nr:mnmA [Chlamydiales bacterium]